MLLAAAQGFQVPHLDYHALLPEIIVAATLTPAPVRAAGVAPAQ